LPPDVRADVAARLLEACEAFGAPASDDLRKIALGLGMLRAGLVAGPIAAGTKSAIGRNLSAVKALEGPGRVVTPAEVKKLAEASGTPLMPSAPSAPAPRERASAGGA